MASSWAPEASTQADIDNGHMLKYIAWTWAAVVAALLVFRLTVRLLHHVRRIANLQSGAIDGRQRYFSIPDQRFASFKRHLLHAPLFSKRHNREFRLSSAVNVGTLPGRLQTGFLLGYFALNVVFCVWQIGFTGEQWYDVATKRTGILAVVNMIPLFLLAGRNNPLISLLGITFDTYNLLHRWIGRIVVVEAAMHMAFWMSSKIAKFGAHKGWEIIVKAMGHSQMILTGMITISALVGILLQSPSIVRHAFYEVFLGIHIMLAIVVVAVLWIHASGFASQQLLAGAIICWIVERALRMLSLIRNNYSRRTGLTQAHVEALPGDAVRVTIRTARPWQFRPGQHLYLYMPTLSPLSNHPFSIVWTSQTDQLANEKALPMARQDILAAQETSVSLIVRRRTGFTDTLYRKAEATGAFSTSAFVEGPYGSESFQSYGTVMLFAAGVGITHQVPHVRDLLSAYARGTCATRKVVLVWIIQSPEHLEWIRPWMTQILAMEHRRDVLKILLFVTRPRSTKEVHSPSGHVQMYPGKPDVRALLAREQETQVGAMAVSVCGTGSLADDVRSAVRARCERTEMDFFEEAFSW